MGILVISGLIDLAIRRNCLIGGDDFKSGQTKMKSVLVDFLVGAGIKVYISFYFLIFGDFVLITSFFPCKLWRHLLIFGLFESILLVANIDCELQPFGKQRRDESLCPPNFPVKRNLQKQRSG